MVRKRTLNSFDPWLQGRRSSLGVSFAGGVLKDKSEASAAITSPWSNGRTKAQITELNLVNRGMYGHRKLDLLQASVIGVT